MIVVVFFFSFLLCFRDLLLLFVLLFLFLPNIFVRVAILVDHPHTLQTFGMQKRQRQVLKDPRNHARDRK